ncbi:MAG: transcription-repair coupling factor [Buchnera aphidicola (Tetraneura akinire)]
MEINQIVVHLEHGIGRYKGLVTIKNNGLEGEYFVIEYAGKTKLYVPVSSLNLITKYEYKTNKDVILNKLGNENWSKNKKKIIKEIYDDAALLLDIYANRATQLGFSFILNKKEYDFFCKKFPYKLTIDQKKTIEDVVKDMQKQQPMDRLVCGDVGFGKTEVAMRACFLAVNNKKQVVILVPTTLLVQQHYDNFIIRFSYLNLEIKKLSRFCTKKEVHQVLSGIKSGQTNIVITTHQILFKNLKWSNLGLLIIDEEHRFGVSQKEKIKSLSLNIDILTLTATPIPRTLNMAIHGIRDLSIIATPPQKKIPVKTFIKKYDPKLIRKTILKEIKRGGQVYYLYNKVKSINRFSQTLSKLVPESKIKVAHGKMNKKELEKIMNDFRKHVFDVLICTTIIETGIDIPRANTMLVHQSDQFGLSQLHQLRGRIGRTNKQSYIWLLVEHYESINYNAKKRLESISLHQKLGSGFVLSKKDLEIRGIGKMLGKEQSGHIESIGSVLYKKILKKAISSIKKGEKFSLNKLFQLNTEIELCIPSLIPTKYIVNINHRISFYRKIAVSNNIETIKKIKNDMIKKFGKMPIFSKNLINIAKIRIYAKKLGIKKIHFNKEGGVIQFNEMNLINFKKLLQIINSEPNKWKIENSKKIKFFKKINNGNERVLWIKNFLNLLKRKKL